METEFNQCEHKLVVKKEVEDMLTSPTSTPLLPDFMTALNMVPLNKDSDSAKRKMDDGEGVLKIDMDVPDSEGEGKQAGVKSLGPGTKDVLIDKFKKGM